MKELILAFLSLFAPVAGTADNNTTQKSDGVSYQLAHTAKGQLQQVIAHTGYTTSYNAKWLTPNWVAYSLNPSKMKGNQKRPSHGFVPDPEVKGNSATHSDYTNSGYSRGHMCPAADMKWSAQAMEESFYLSNVCPQLAEMNAGVWEHLENHVRKLARKYTVYICCGPIMAKNHKNIGKHGVAVPSKFFKVLLLQKNGKWQAIGYVMPNSNITGSIYKYAMSVDDVEKLTGHDFFYNLPDNIEKSVEAKYNTKDWQ